VVEGIHISDQRAVKAIEKQARRNDRPRSSSARRSRKREGRSPSIIGANGNKCSTHYLGSNTRTLHCADCTRSGDQRGYVPNKLHALASLYIKMRQRAYKISAKTSTSKKTANIDDCSCFGKLRWPVGPLGASTCLCVPLVRHSLPMQAYPHIKHALVM